MAALQAEADAAVAARDRLIRYAPADELTLGNLEWVWSRIAELRTVDLACPFDHLGAALNVFLKYKPNSKILLAYHQRFSTSGLHASREQMLDRINARMAEQLKLRVSTLQWAEGLRERGKLEAIKQFKAPSDEPMVLFLNLDDACKKALVGLNLPMIDLMIAENANGEVTSANLLQAMGRGIRKQPLPAGFDYTANPESQFPDALVIDLCCKPEDGGGSHSRAASEHRDQLQGFRAIVPNRPAHNNHPELIAAATGAGAGANANPTPTPTPSSTRTTEPASGRPVCARWVRV